MCVRLITVVAGFHTVRRKCVARVPELCVELTKFSCDMKLGMYELHLACVLCDAQRRCCGVVNLFLIACAAFSSKGALCCGVALWSCVGAVAVADPRIACS